jgi:hypothetical protein
MKALLDDINLALKIGGMEIVCLRREIRQLKQLFEQVIEVADLDIELCQCRHGYYIRDAEGDVVPEDWTGWDDGPDHTQWYDPDNPDDLGYHDPDYPDYQC